METSSLSPGMDVCLLQPSPWSEFLSLLCRPWVAWLLLDTGGWSPAHLSASCVLGHSGLWLCSEGSRAAPTETLWEEAKPSSRTHTGESQKPFHASSDQNSTDSPQTSPDRICSAHKMRPWFVFSQQPHSEGISASNCGSIDPEKLNLFLSSVNPVMNS